MCVATFFHHSFWLLICNCYAIEIKFGILPSKTNCFTCFNEIPLKMMRITFCFILKALFVSKIFKLLSWLFDHVKNLA